MTNDMLPPLGVTFYCPTDEDFKQVAAIRERLEAAEIPNMWTTQDWQGKKVTALDVFANANVVAQYLRD
jgi:hypothetical protein